MRDNPTKAEARLWLSLEKSQLGGFRFYNQKVVYGYIPDFYCPKLLLAVEVAGSWHDGREEADDKRDKILAKYGITVLRFTNEEVFRRLPWVLRRILEASEDVQ